MLWSFHLQLPWNPFKPLRVIMQVNTKSISYHSGTAPILLLQYKAISSIPESISHIFILFISALQPEQDLNLRKLAVIDVI